MKPTILRSLFSHSATEAIRSYTQNELFLYPLIRDDRFSRLAGHDIPFYSRIHAQLTDYASSLFGEQVKPSYCFVSLYDDQGICPIHVDRPQCRYTIDYLIDQEGDDIWPIYISEAISDDQRAEIEANMIDPYDPEETERFKSFAKGWQTVELRPGDAVAYSGTHSVHYRERTPLAGASLVFWHFVPVTFEGDLK